MKKGELLTKLSEDSGLTQGECDKVLDSLGKVVIEACIENDDFVNIPSLGRFRRRVNKARKGINPLTQKPMDIKESHNIKFTPTSSVKKVIE